jgi:hypothetical protein
MWWWIWRMIAVWIGFSVLIVTVVIILALIHAGRKITQAIPPITPPVIPPIIPPATPPDTPSVDLAAED